MSQPSPQNDLAPFQFSIRSVFFWTTIVAFMAVVGRAFGSPFCWLIPIPLAIIALLAQSTGLRTMIGAVAGFNLCMIVLLVVGVDTSDPRLMKSVIAVSICGGSIGASVHALVRKLWMLGGVSLAVAIVGLGAGLILSVASFFM